MQFNIRTHNCGELTEKNVDEKVVLNGWVDRRRDLGGLIFIWLRDRYGITESITRKTAMSTCFIFHLLMLH